MFEQFSLFDGSQEFKINKPVRLIELFAGYGSQSLALDYLGVDYESWRICEWAVKSIQAYKDIHFENDNIDYSQRLKFNDVINYLYKKGISSNYNEPMSKEQIRRMGEERCRQTYNNIIATHNLVSVCNCRAEDLKIVDVDKYCYIMTYSFPCFTKDSLVLTDSGYKQIIDVKIGDYVLSHDNKYHKVINTFDNGMHYIYSIKGMGIDEIKTTSNHKFYVREMYYKGHKARRCFTEPKWKETKDLSNKDYLGIAINQNNTAYIHDKLPTQNNHFWWIVGRYLGDGWLRSQNGIIICCAKNELQEITYHLDKLPFKYSIVEEETVYKIHIAIKSLGDFMAQFGRGANNKHLTKLIFDLPVYYLVHVVEGYMSADGCFTNGVYKATSTSRELIYGMAQCVAKVYETPYRVYKVKTSPKKVIDNREINQNDWYQLVYKLEKCKQDKAFYEDGYIWYPIKDIACIGVDNVYDIEVEDSHSFTVQNTIVHNCQDLSLAGDCKGMEKGSGTRSGLLWEVERILKECKELPQVLLMENVTQVHSKINIEDFNNWKEVLEKLGYKNYYKDLNAKNFGIPQNRDRCFMVSILGDYKYEFPHGEPLELKLKDLLEPKVEEKYYISASMIKYITATNNKWTGNNNSCKVNKSVASTINTGEGSRRCDASNYIADGIPEDYNLRDSEIKIKGDKAIIPENTKKGYAIATDGDGIYLNRPHQKRGCVQKDMIQTIKTSPSDLGVVVRDDVPEISSKNVRIKKLFKDMKDKESCQFLDIYNQKAIKEETATLKAGMDYQQGNIIYNELRIRKLTPKECFRLMGVKDKDYEKIAKNQSNSSLYHLAGDSIVVNVLEGIFKEML